MESKILGNSYLNTYFYRKVIPMKTAIHLILNLIIICSLRAQFVPIKDPKFSNFLKNKYPDCVVNGQLDTTCSGIVNETQLNCSNLGITSIDEIVYFDKLKNLICSNNAIAIVPSLAKIIDLRFLIVKVIIYYYYQNCQSLLKICSVVIIK